MLWKPNSSAQISDKGTAGCREHKPARLLPVKWDRGAGKTISFLNAQLALVTMTYAKARQQLAVQEETCAAPKKKGILTALGRILTHNAFLEESTQRQKRCRSGQVGKGAGGGGEGLEEIPRGRKQGGAPLEGKSCADESEWRDVCIVCIVCVVCVVAIVCITLVTMLAAVINDSVY